MDQKTIEKMAIITTIVGLLLLHIISQDITPTYQNNQPSSSPNQINIQGTITKITTIDKAIFLEVEGQTIQTKKVIIFTQEPIGIKVGDSVEVEGTTQTRNGQHEIIANEIKLQ